MPTPPQNQGPVLHHPNTPSKPQHVARTIGDVVASGLVIAFWVVAGAAGLGAAYIALRAVIWAVELAKAALGL